MSPDRLKHLKTNGQRWKCKFVTVSALHKTPALIEGLQIALENWNAGIQAAGIDFKFVYSDSSRANIVVQMEALPDDFIGISQPPNGDNNACHSVALNSNKPFGIHKNNPGHASEGEQIGSNIIRHNTIDIVRVLMHELGHAIGLKHVAIDAAIMNAQHTNNSNTTPTPADLEMVRALYA